MASARPKSSRQTLPLPACGERAGGGQHLPLPACGERAGARGNNILPLPACGARAGVRGRENLPHDPHRAMDLRLAAPAAGDGAARAVHALPAPSRRSGTASSPRRRAAGRVVFVGADNYRQLVEDPIFWQALSNNFWYAIGTIPASIVIAILMAIWVNERIPGRGLLRLAYFTPTILPMIAVANIWLFFYTPEYGLLEQVPGPVRRAEPQLARQQEHGAAGADGGDDLEGSRLLHDLLPGGAAVDVAAPRRSRGDRRRVALVFLSPRHVSAADADDAVRAGQRGDQRVPPGRPHRRHDARRPRQRDGAAAVLRLRDRLPLLGLGVRGGADVVLLVILGLVALAQFHFLERRVHYQ